MQADITADTGPSASAPRSKDRSVSRRSFLAAGVAVPTFLPRHVIAGAERQAPSDKLRIAAVGVGGMGAAYLHGCRREEIVALCDLDHDFAGRTFQRFSGATRYHDFREMFDKEADNIDAVIIATPDHTHAVILMQTLALQKHVYCAKPITHTIGESRKIRKAFSRSSHLITKTSAQFCGTSNSRSSTELLQTGVVGPIHEVHIWHGRQPMYACSMARPTEKQTPPPVMDGHCSGAAGR